ncbi:fucosyl transferase [Onchocerca flexuosa]|uniref:Fucosyltransferase n=1 Tax=Onchocerca flexuosa TaxID=387005 RepID=A0A238BS75_9BILA|nr:fucosyl transferase [Onchocerca flexuosa]
MIATIAASDQKLLNVPSMPTRYFKQLTYRLRYFLIVITVIYGFYVVSDSLINYKLRSKKESAANYAIDDLSFNLSLNFIRKSPISSPYGYTVKLAKASRPIGSLIDNNIILNKTKPIAWFVSNCRTESQRELWKHGYGHDIIPIILKRSIVERYVPPHSFIAVDDFTTIRDLAVYLKYLMHNLSAYKEYFEWRRKYKVLFLDGNNHDQLERPWGFCQLCRLLWMNPRPKYVISDFSNFWINSCELSGTVVLQEDISSNKLNDVHNIGFTDYNLQSFFNHNYAINYNCVINALVPQEKI